MIIRYRYIFKEGTKYKPACYSPTIFEIQFPPERIQNFSSFEIKILLETIHGRKVSIVNLFKQVEEYDDPTEYFYLSESIWKLFENKLDEMKDRVKDNPKELARFMHDPRPMKKRYKAVNPIEYIYETHSYIQSYNQICKLTGIAKGTISNIRRGTISRIHWRTARLLTVLINKPPVDIREEYSRWYNKQPKPLPPLREQILETQPTTSEEQPDTVVYSAYWQPKKDPQHNNTKKKEKKKTKSKQKMTGKNQAYTVRKLMQKQANA